MIDPTHDDVFVDDRPIMLRAVDREDSPQELLIELADQFRVIVGEMHALRTIVSRDLTGDFERAHRRAMARVVEIDEAFDRAEHTRERLTRALRLAGRL